MFANHSQENPSSPPSDLLNRQAGQPAVPLATGFWTSVWLLSECLVAKHICTEFLRRSIFYWFLFFQLIFFFFYKNYSFTARLSQILLSARDFYVWFQREKTITS